ncbi:MAG: response regulator, partial [Deltaproteobacteria bacterium]|nr:response regulator [Deltaproteobacteria bacterium]
PSPTVGAIGFITPNSTVRFAVPNDWTVEVVPGSPSALDLAEVFGVASTAAAGPSLTLRVRRGAMTIHLIAGWQPVPCTVRRLMIMPADATAEVVSIEGFEGLLVRPDRLIQGTGRIAILDDSEICREMVKASLEPFGIEVLGLEDPSILIGTLAAASVDMMLLDLSFENLDIADLIRRMRAAIPNLPVFLHSDRPVPELQRLAELSAADGYLSKTADADQLVARVSRVLRSRRAEH